MTDPSTSAPLSPFEGKPVLGVGIEIPGAAGGLRDALTVDPIEKHYDDEVVVVLVTKVGKLRFDPVKDTDGWKRVHVLDVQEGMIVDKDLVAEHLAQQRERLAELRLQQESEERGGVITFPTDEELHAAHVAGDHAEALIEGCVDCDLELQAVASEGAADAAAGAEDEAPAPDEYSGLVVLELKAELKKRKLPVSGSAEELRDRLRAHDRGDS